METMAKAGDTKYPIGWPEIGKVLLWGSLLGFGGRGAVGLYRMAKRRLEEREDKNKGQELTQMMSTPGPEALQSYQETPKLGAYISDPGIKAHPLSREAQGLGPVVKDPISDEEQEAQVKSPVNPIAPVASPMSQGVKQALHPLPASILAITAGAGGLYGGWQLADKLMDQERIKSLDDDIEQAKKEYEEMLRGKARLELVLPKTAAFIDSMMQSAERGELVKEAGFLNVLPYFIYTTLAAAVAGEAYNAYKAQAKASPEAIKIEALKNQPRNRRVVSVQARMAKPLSVDELEPVSSLS